MRTQTINTATGALVYYLADKKAYSDVLSHSFLNKKETLAYYQELTALFQSLDPTFNINVEKNSSIAFCKYKLTATFNNIPQYCVFLLAGLMRLPNEAPGNYLAVTAYALRAHYKEYQKYPICSLILCLLRRINHCWSTDTLPRVPLTFEQLIKSFKETDWSKMYENSQWLIKTFPRSLKVTSSPEDYLGFTYHEVSRTREPDFIEKTHNYLKSL